MMKNPDKNRKKNSSRKNRRQRKRRKNTLYLPVWIALFCAILLITVIVLFQTGLFRKDPDPSVVPMQEVSANEVTPTAAPSPAAVVDLYDGIVSLSLEEPFEEAGSGDNNADTETEVAPPEVNRSFETNLPVLYLSTDSGAAVTSRDEYAPAHLILGGKEYTLGIRGRGNTTWRYYPQKSYLLKLDEEASLLGMVKARKYVLVSNYVDRSLIRNSVAMEIASCMDHLEYTPKQMPVDVYLNGKYIGVYTFSEKIEPGQDKVDLFADQGMPVAGPVGKDTPFFLETGKDLFNFQVRYGQDYFTTPHSPHLQILYPELKSTNTEEAAFIMDYMNRVDSAFVNKEGWQELIDTDSWVDWFIVMEMCVNTDSALWRSTFLYRQENGRLKIGPVWDFDMAMGNFSYDNTSYRYWSSAEQVYDQAQNHYMTYLYRSDEFMLAVRERWDEKKEELLETAFAAVDRYTEQVSLSRPQNDSVYGRSSRDEQALHLKDFLQKRYDWIDESIHMDDFNRHAPTYSIGETVNAEDAAEQAPVQ